MTEDDQTLTFECGACGASFKERMEHVQDCPGPFPASWWSEDHGPVLWWQWDRKKGDWVDELPYLGTPMDAGHRVEIRTQDAHAKPTVMHVGGWPARHTHWTPLPAKPGTPNFLT